MTRSMIAIVLVMCAAAAAAVSAADLSGKWVGVTQVPDVGDDTLTLDLKADGAGYTGVLSDSAGMVVASPITNVKVDGATLAFDIAASGGSVTVHVTLTADGDTLSGSWAADQGPSGPLTLTRQKT